MIGKTVEVGEEIPARTVEVTRQQIAEYAEVSGDHNPIHLDDEFAKSVGLPGLIAHGMLDLGLLTQTVVDWAGDHRRLRELRCRFSGLVKPGDRLTCRGRVVSLNSNTVELEIWAENQAGEKVLSKGYALLAR